MADVSPKTCGTILQGIDLLERNGRWGTCVSCPRAERKVYPELCPNTKRYDHQLTRQEMDDLIGRVLTNEPSTQTTEKAAVPGNVVSSPDI